VETGNLPVSSLISGGLNQSNGRYCWKSDGHWAWKGFSDHPVCNKSLQKTEKNTANQLTPFLRFILFFARISQYWLVFIPVFKGETVPSTANMGFWPLLPTSSHFYAEHLADLKNTK
jgi:hypothetical protein